MSRRLTEWNSFSEVVSGHIEDYTVAQYGDLPDDQASGWSAEDCVKQVQRYANRFGRGQRGRAEELRDLLKVAHYACMAYGKVLNGGPPECLTSKL